MLLPTQFDYYYYYWKDSNMTNWGENFGIYISDD
ncbi:hypothetical protein EV200_107213 [Pedobacter psychrotolerans]|uniref:Uncharacterized protein n=1 Tax=Pedobacter psychrotolerans TaxID=1843235 RepID=A0A4R2H6B7_9SPHI|nr:hypothetical protein EV200_107213 [Pedobacter psychrotolerans]